MLTGVSVTAILSGLMGGVWSSIVDVCVAATPFTERSEDARSCKYAEL